MAASYRGRYTPGALEVPSGGTLKLAGTAVTSTASELNLLDASNTEPASGPWVAVSRWAKAEYDFAGAGGAIGDFDLGVTIPDNAVVLSCIIEKITAFTSGGSATVALKIEGAGDCVAATAFDNAAFTGAVTVGAALGSTKFKTTAARNVTMTVATAALTAGKYNFHIEYLIGE